MTDTELFRQAEILLHRGDFEAARSDYERFLEQHPESPLAPMAELRLANIDAELEALLGRGPNSPIYIRPPSPVEAETSVSEQSASSRR